MRASFTTPEKEFQTAKNQFEIGLPIWDKIMDTFPKDIPADMYVSHLGSTCMRYFITTDEECTDSQLLRAIKWLKDFAPLGFNKFFREECGRFAYQGHTQIGIYPETPDIIIFLETANLLSCEVKKVTKEVTVYESICTKTLEQELA
jgi:hypothetical protein